MPALIAICIGHETLTLDLTVPLFDVRDRTVSHVHDAPHEGLLHDPFDRGTGPGARHPSRAGHLPTVYSSAL